MQLYHRVRNGIYIFDICVFDRLLLMGVMEQDWFFVNAAFYLTRSLLMIDQGEPWMVIRIQMFPGIFWKFWG